MSRPTALTGYAFGLILAGTIDMARGWTGGWVHLLTGAVVIIIDIFRSEKSSG